MPGEGLTEYRAALMQWYTKTYAVGSNPLGVAFDGSNIWVINANDATVTKMVASTGAIVGTYSVGVYPYSIAFDGTNIWVANANPNTVTVLTASTGALVGTYPAGNNPLGLAFDEPTCGSQIMEQQLSHEAFPHWRDARELPCGSQSSPCGL